MKPLLHETGCPESESYGESFLYFFHFSVILRRRGSGFIAFQAVGCLLFAFYSRYRWLSLPRI
jgi:hypothetical protein